MTEQGEGERRSHFILTDNGIAEAYRYPPRDFGQTAVPERNRREHGFALQAQIDALAPRFDAAREVQEEAGVGEGYGLRVTFESFPGLELAIDSLAREPSGIELLNVRVLGEQSIATVFIPDGKLHLFENKIRAYLDESRGTSTGPANAKLWNVIQAVRVAKLEDLWADATDAWPAADDETIWWEVWLPTRKDRDALTAEFRRLAQQREFALAAGELKFPERTVVLIRGTATMLKASMLVLNSIAALRRAKETAEFFDVLPPEEQPEWVDDLLSRMDVAGADAGGPRVCLLDTGINRGHPLLSPALDKNDLHTVDAAWGVNDNEGHGTALAGLALFGNLVGPLSSTTPIVVDHRLESVKLLPGRSSGNGTADHHGYLTVQAVNLPAINAPERVRVFSMAVTAKDQRDRGKPSAWSAAIDALTSGASDEDDIQRLFVISAGNTQRDAWSTYPHSNTTDAIHDPGQSWNALTVGANTHLVQITGARTAGYTSVAPSGGLSPHSTTSAAWESHWPLKPDVVFEGGNVARDTLGTVLTVGSLRLLTTNYQPQVRLFDLADATSAAAALAARMAAQLMARYPHLRPESIRALMVHSAEWTPSMRQMFLPAGRPSNKADMARLIRHCGFGEPDMARAMWSVDNSLTLVCENDLQPFRREGSGTKLNEMRLHRLPWPLAELEGLGETQVEMRVTLSYFIEPNPSQRGVTSRYRYESHGLRFRVKWPGESEDDFRARINVADRDGDYEPLGGSDSGWIVGPNNRSRGSLHSDIWIGSAADLAARGVIAVYPTSGWWRTRRKLERHNAPARYTLVVSIRAPGVDVDLYTSIESQIKTAVEITT